MIGYFRAWIFILIGTSLGVAACGSAQAQAVGRSFTAAEVRADLEQMLDYIENTHPGLDIVSNRAELRRAKGALSRDIRGPLNVRQAWLALARLNPLFRDAHTGLRHPVAEFDSYREAGGAIFSIPVLLDRQGHLRAASSVAAETGLAPFERITTINGRSTDAIIRELMPRMRGETESIQRLVLAFNFSGYLWTLMGPEDSFEVEVLASDGSVRRHRLRQPTAAGSAAPPAPYSLRIVGNAALLRASSFDPQLRDAFARFLEESFATIAARRLETLIIDVRDNLGGAHDVSDLLIGYLTTNAVSPTSALTARITADNRDVAPNAALGSVVTVPFVEPIERNTSRPPFGGRVFVLIGENTYSQAIVFASTVKDNGLGMLVGETTGGAANQTGQITLSPLTNTRLQALAPLYIIYRRSGDIGRGGLEPDIRLAHDPANPDAMVDRFIASLRQDPPTAARGPDAEPSRAHRPLARQR